MVKPGAVAEEVAEEVVPGAEESAVVADEEKPSGAEFVEDSGEGVVEEPEVVGETPEQEVQRLREDKIRFEERERVREEQEKKGTSQGDPWYVPPETMQLYAKQSGLPEASVRFILGVVRSATEWNSKTLEGKFSPLVADRGFDAAVRQMAKDKRYADAGRYTTQMKDFLEDLSPEQRLQPKWMEKALNYARGVKAPENRRGAVKGEEISRKVARGSEPGSARGTGGKTPAKGAKQEKLTDLEMSMYERFGKRIFKSPEEYKASLKTK